VDEKILVRGSRTMKGLVDRGIPVRQVSTRAGLEADPDAFPALQWRNGGEARVIDQLPTKACIVDRRFALVPVDLKVLAHGLMIITDPVVVNILVATHQSLWQSGEDPRAHGSEPPPHLRAVLAMLASGLPDDRAAERAGLSPRTYSRRVNELMRLLGARSRFEAGIEAARRGWI
jgi:DNA-binding CsgD family transcriptional regulator